jgi:enoyl-CoA hydratase/carnithine racemase
MPSAIDSALPEAEREAAIDARAGHGATFVGMTEHVRVTRDDGVLQLVLARPEKKNALTGAMYGALASALESANADDSVRAILLCADGELFCAGNDIGEFAQAAMTKSAPPNVERFLFALAGAQKPVVAAVQGRAVGVGTTMLLHCDYVVVSESALLSAPFVGLALVPEAASSLLLPARIGHARAFSMFVLGETVDAQKAVEWGLANQRVPDASLRAVAATIARKIADLPVGAVMTTKRLMRDEAAVRDRIAVEGASFVERLASDEAREAFTAFAERRPPVFRKG